MDDPQHRLDTARRVVATITYSTASGQIGTATGTGSVPECAARFDVWTVEAIGLGESAQMRGGLEAGCSPMYYPLDGSQIQWRSLNPDIASVTSSGLLKGHSHGLATIQGTYGRAVSSHQVRVEPR